MVTIDIDLAKQTHTMLTQSLMDRYNLDGNSLEDIKNSLSVIKSLENSIDNDIEFVVRELIKSGEYDIFISDGEYDPIYERSKKLGMFDPKSSYWINEEIKQRFAYLLEQSQEE